MDNWAAGYSPSELDQAQERYGLRFLPDLVALLLDRRPIRGYNWTTENAAIREMLNWPFFMLHHDVEHGMWWPDWGDRPEAPREREEVLRSALAKAPRLIPLLSHRFNPDTPDEPGNPIFSMHGFDTIYYCSNLEEYFRNEFERRHVIGPVRHIPFWSDIEARQCIRIPQWQG
ncbi:hypothetical protein [Acidisphaera sp. L21]|uniref:hypothetical protein n=1 Tax=Acidisphaera sp. L21 TaxID=1641851 RepID=UPI00131C5896|nr:hypothetical protein [Acidisphaera sp. L21]